MLRSTRLLAVALSLSIATPFAAPVLAQKPAASADSLLKKGKEQFAKKLYADARTSFAAAYESTPSGHAAYWAGRASEELRELEAAADWYGKAMAGGKLGPGEDAAVRFDALAKEAVTVVIETTPDGATVRIDGKEFAQKTPFFAHLTPGQHHVVVEVGGKSATREVDIAPYKKTRVEISVEGAAANEAPKPAEPKPAEPTPATAAPAPAPAPVEPTTTIHRTPLTRRLSYITAGGAIVALGLGTMYGIKALSDDRAFEKDPTPEREDIGRRHALVSDVSFVLGAGLAITSVVLFFTSKSTETVAITPAVSPTFAGGAFSIKF